MKYASHRKFTGIQKTWPDPGGSFWFPKLFLEMNINAASEFSIFPETHYKGQLGHLGQLWKILKNWEKIVKIWNSRWRTYVLMPSFPEYFHVAIGLGFWANFGNWSKKRPKRMAPSRKMVHLGMGNRILGSGIFNFWTRGGEPFLTFSNLGFGAEDDVWSEWTIQRWKALVEWDWRVPKKLLIWADLDLLATRVFYSTESPGMGVRPFGFRFQPLVELGKG